MDIQQTKKLISWLEKKDFIAAGFDDEMIETMFKASWWNKVATDIINTPDFAEPDAPPEKVLSYARDVITEYVNKRLLAQ